MTLTAGIHDEIPAEQYHADLLCDQPTFSSGTAKLLLAKSPLHVRTQHPRLNPNFKREAEDKFDLGTCAHELLLRGLDIAQIIQAPDWKTKAAREERDDARKSGLVPMLAKDWERVQEMVAAVRDQLAVRDVSLFVDGKPEQTLLWDKQGALCRARCDWLRDDYRAIDDLKTTRASANPHEWSRRTLWSIGAELQVALYRRGVRALTGVNPDFHYCVAECEAPYAVSVIALAPSALEFAERKLDRALLLWRRCLESSIWPGYPTEVAYAELPPWEETQFLEAHYEPEAAAA